MPANNSPRADWDEIAVRFKAGESGRSLAKAYGISHTAVQLRAKREGWQPGKAASWKRRIRESDALQKQRFPSNKEQVAALTHPHHATGELSRRTEENARVILAEVACGAKPQTAARSVGFENSAWSEWLRDDPVLKLLVQAAEEGRHCADERGIAAASDRGDWKAGLTRLERGKHTREDWAAPEKVAGTGGITVVFNWSRDEPPPIIDVTPTVTPGDDTDGQA